MDSQAISYLSAVWVLYSPLFPIIAFPRWQVERECFCSWSVHLLSDIRNIFAITAVWNLYASESLRVFILSCAQKRLSKPLASIGALASRTLPTPHHSTLDATRPSTIANARRRFVKPGAFTGRVQKSSINVNAGMLRSIFFNSWTIFNLTRVLKRNAIWHRRNATAHVRISYGSCTTPFTWRVLEFKTAVNAGLFQVELFITWYAAV